MTLAMVMRQSPLETLSPLPPRASTSCLRPYHTVQHFDKSGGSSMGSTIRKKLIHLAL